MKVKKGLSDNERAEDGLGYSLYDEIVNLTEIVVGTKGLEDDMMNRS